MHGYAGRLLFVDLSTGTLRDEPLTEDLARNFIGGYGLGARVLYSRMKPGVDALGPESVLGFVTGPVTGTEANFGSRYTVVCKSPVSGTWNDSNSGGYFGPELKKAGYDGVFISGISPHPVYLWIREGRAELRDAAGLWGLDAVETQKALEADTGESRLRAAVIGPAGEKLSLISCVINDGHRAAGRGGLGAVMGSKRLKAVAVRGTGEIQVAEPDRVKEINLAIRAALKADPYAGYFRSGGTGAGTPDSVFNGDAPVKNWGQAGVAVYAPEQAESLSGIKISEKYLVKHYACARCPLGCGAELAVHDGRYSLESTARPEYETLAAFGPLCGNTRVEAILKCNDLCNRAGLDTISAGATIAWAIECFENGVLTREETDGLDLGWGNADAIVEATRAMAEGRGFGAVLALGSQGAADRLQKGHEFLQTVRGIELPMHDPRLYPGLARTYQFDPTPGRHVKGGIGLTQGYLGPEKYQPDGSGPADVQATAFNEMLSSGGFCLFISYFGGSDQVFPMIAAVTGFDMPTLESAAVRILTLRQAFNQREGLTRADFRSPVRSVGRPALTAGPTAGGVVDSEALGDNFYAELGWDVKTGKPTRETLMRLGGMEDVIKDLY